MDETGIGVALGLVLFVGMILAAVIFGGVFVTLAIVVCVPVVFSLIMFDDVVATLCWANSRSARNTLSEVGCCDGWSAEGSS